ncbi:hypothetical protein TNCV_2466971 [Trichonephila clavipes]|nr:hypothetical protein TNCV_2466971 [Trichonephila clavipes]
MLNDDEIVTSVLSESDPVDDKTDEDEDNNNDNSKVHQMLTRFSSSKKTLNYPEVNTRFVYGMRQIRKGFSAGFKLCGTLNLPRLSKTAYTNHENKPMSVISEVSELSMQKAASELF